MSDGYLKINVDFLGKSYKPYLHQMVAWTFVPNPDAANKVEIHHIDENRLNNAPANLLWVSKVEHRQISAKNGQTSAKLTPEDVIFIRENYWLLGKRALMERFSIKGSTVCNIATGRSRTYVNHAAKHQDARPMLGYKPIVDTRTGIFYTSDELAFVLDTTRKEVSRMIGEERKPNTSQYRYA